MTANVLDPLVQEAQEALRSFLASLLGADAPLEVSGPERADAPAVPDGAVLLRGQPGSGPAFAVVLEAGWADRLAEAMIGGPIPEEEAGDLLGEAAGQAYGALRTHLAAAGQTLPDASFAVGAADDLASLGLRIAFSLAAAEGALGGAVFLADEVAAGTQPEVPPAAAAGAPAVPTEPVAVAPVAFDNLGAESIGGGGVPDLQRLSDVELDVTVELGRRRLPLADVLRLTTGSVVELDKMVGQPLAIFANGRLIAEGEAVVIDDQFGVRVTSLASTQRPRSALV